MCKEESSSGPYYRSQYMSHFTSIQEAALLKIPIAVKFCRTGSCEHPLTTASSAESCVKTCFLQATFTVCCHKALFLLSQQTNVGNFVLLDAGITVRRIRAKHSVGNIFFPFFGSNMARGKRRYSVCLSAVISKLWCKQQWSILHKYFLLYYFPNEMALKNRTFFPSHHRREMQIKDTFP